MSTVEEHRGGIARTLRRPVLTLSVVAFVALAALPASSAPAATTTAKITLTPAYGPPLTPVTVKGRGFGPKESVTVELADQLVAGATTDNTGRFHASFRISSDLMPDVYTVVAVGADSGISAKRGFDVRTDWRRFRFDAANAGKNLTESMLGVTNVALLQRGWKFQTGGMIRSSPVVYGHVVYFGSNDGNVYALDATTGLEKWHFMTGAAVVSVPDIVGGVVYVGSEDHRVYALDANSGRELWHFATNGAVDSSPLVSRGIVYAGSADGSLYALRAGRAPAALLWSFATKAQITTAPGVLGTNVYVSSWDGNVYELDAAGGRLIHTYQTAGPVETSPALASFNGIDWLIFGSDDHNVYAFDTLTFKRKWVYPSAGDVYSSVAISLSEKDGIVLIGTHNWNMESHDLQTGDINWLYSCPQGQAVESSPAIANGVVYYGCRNHSVYALDTSVRGPGAGVQPLRLPVWSFSTGGPIYSSPAVSDGQVYIGSDDGNLYMFGL